MSTSPDPSSTVPYLVVDLDAVAHRIAELVTVSLRDALQGEASPWLDVGTAAGHLGCSEERLRKLVQRRAVPFHQERPGARIFFNRSELDQWLLEQ